MRAFRIGKWARGENQNLQVCIFGRKGSGKTVLASEYIARADKPVVIIDTAGEFEGEYYHPGFSKRGGPLFTAHSTSPDELIECLEEAFELMEDKLPAYPANYVFSVTLVSGRLDSEDDRKRQFNRCIYDCFAIGNLILIIDELDQWCSPNQLPGGLRNVINLGRHVQVDFVALSRRPARVHRDVTANADRWHVFQTVEPRDVDYLRSVVPPSQVSEVDKLPELKVAEFVTFDVRDV